MYNVQLPGSKTFDSQIIMHSCTPKTDSSLDKEFQNICIRMIVNMHSLIRENTGKDPVKENGQTEIIMFRKMPMLHTKMWKCIVIPTNSQH